MPSINMGGDLDYFARTVAGTRAETPKIDVPSGGGGGRGGNLIQQNIGQSRLGEAMGLIGGVMLGRHIQKKEKDKDLKKQELLNQMSLVGFKGTTKEYLDILKSTGSNQEIARNQLMLVKNKFGTTMDSEGNEVLNIPSDQQLKSEAESFGREKGAEKVAQEPATKARKIEEAKAVSDIQLNAETKLKTIEEQYAVEKDKRKELMDINAENRLQKSPSYLKELEVQNARIAELQASKAKLMYETEKEEFGEKAGEEHDKRMNAFYKELNDLHPSLIDKSGRVKAVKRGSKEEEVLLDTAWSKGIAIRMNKVKETKWGYGADIVEPYITRPGGATVPLSEAVLEANKSKKLATKLSPEQQKLFEENKKKIPGLTEEIFLEEIGKEQNKTKPAEKPVINKFDPEGKEYDMESAIKAGLKPDETGHWPSREPKTGLLLKGKKHSTWHKTEESEKTAGYEIYQKNGRYYSRKKEEPKKIKEKYKDSIKLIDELYEKLDKLKAH